VRVLSAMSRTGHRRRFLSNGRIPGKFSFRRRAGNSTRLTREACSLFILEKGKPVVRPGRKAVDHGASKAAWLPGYRRDDPFVRRAAGRPGDVRPGLRGAHDK
jgi:hypothetical protein